MTCVDPPKTLEDELRGRIQVLESQVQLLREPLRRLILWNVGLDGNQDPVKYLKSVVDQAEEALRKLEKPGTA